MHYDLLLFCCEVENVILNMIKLICVLAGNES